MWFKKRKDIQEPSTRNELLELLRNIREGDDIYIPSGLVKRVWNK